MITDKITESILHSLQQLYQIHPKSADVDVSLAPNREHGDYSTSVAFRLAKELKKSPADIAKSLAESLATGGEFKNVVALNGFVNIYLNHDYFQSIVAQILSEKSHYADLEMLKGKKIQVEFISANPTGPLTLANGRGGFGGDVLASVFAKCGATVEREYYVNDGGNQVKLLGDSILAAVGKHDKDDNLYKGPYIEEWAKDNSEVIENNSGDSFSLGSIAARELLEKRIKPSVSRMGISFDRWFSEKEMIDSGEVEEGIENLKKYNHTYEKDGALWLKTTESGDDKDRVLVKTDGEKTYFANDIAYHFDKFYKRHFDLVVNFWGADHHGYVGRMMAAVSLSVGTVGTLRIAIMQMVRLIKDGQEYKMSKRKGTFVTMDDLLELIGGNEKEAADVARFFFLMRSFNTHMDFDLDLAKERSDKNPVFYVKYAYARICSILTNYESLFSHPENTKDPGLDSSARPQNDGGVKADLSLLIEPQETELIEQMAQLPQVIASIVMFDEYPVHYLTFYAIDLAKKFHVFYDKCRVIDEDNLQLTAARIELVKATQIVLGVVMRDLIGIDTPEKM
jgi:arginyl-tRNA synthetase